MRGLIFFLMSALFLGTPLLAWAETGGAHCELSATPLVFGQYSPTAGSPSDVTLTLTVACVASSSEPAAIEGSIALVGGTTERRLTSGSGELRYQLYLDPARSRLWGDGVSAGEAATVSGMVAPDTTFRQTIAIYGRVLGRQTHATVGHYTDRIDAVLQY